MASAGAAIWLTDKERFFMELSTMMTRAQQQRNATANQFDTSEPVPINMDQATAQVEKSISLLFCP